MSPSRATGSASCSCRSSTGSDSRTVPQTVGTSRNGSRAVISSPRCEHGLGPKRAHPNLLGSASSETWCKASTEQKRELVLSERCLLHVGEDGGNWDTSLLKQGV